MISHYVIYDSPKDFPGKFVVREHLISEAGRSFGKAETFSSLKDARESIPTGLTRFGRSQYDDAVIVETWL